MYTRSGVYKAAELSREAVSFGANGGLDDPSNGQPIASIWSLGSEGTGLFLWDPVSFAQQNGTLLPALPHGSAPQLQGLAVFYDAAGTSRFVLYRTGDADYAIVSM